MFWVDWIVLLLLRSLHPVLSSTVFSCATSCWLWLSSFLLSLALTSWFPSLCLLPPFYASPLDRLLRLFPHRSKISINDTSRVILMVPTTPSLVSMSNHIVSQHISTSINRRAKVYFIICISKESLFAPTKKMEILLTLCCNQNNSKCFQCHGRSDH